MQLSQHADTPPHSSSAQDLLSATWPRHRHSDRGPHMPFDSSESDVHFTTLRPRPCRCLLLGVCRLDMRTEHACPLRVCCQCATRAHPDSESLGRKPRCHRSMERLCRPLVACGGWSLIESRKADLHSFHPEVSLSAPLQWLATEPLRRGSANRVSRKRL